MAIEYWLIIKDNVLGDEHAYCSPFSNVHDAIKNHKRVDANLKEFLPLYLKGRDWRDFDLEIKVEYFNVN